MFNQLELLPADPILGLITRFKEDNNPNKVDLGVGVYKNEAGQTPVMQAVAQAEARVIQQQTTKAYIGPKGPEINVEKMMACLAEVPAGDLVLLHGSCHNPSGADLSPQQWQSILELAQAKGFIPFVDMAYQGFANGVEEDAYGFRLLAENLPECILALSCSKNFGLYRERVGAIAVVSPGQSRADIITSHIASIVRGIYSMPPSHGALIVAEILADAKLSDLWQQELAEMRQRLFETRATVAQKRISLCGFNTGNIDYFAKSLAEVETM